MKVFSKERRRELFGKKKGNERNSQENEVINYGRLKEYPPDIYINTHFN